MGFKGEICRRDEAFPRFYKNRDLELRSRKAVKQETGISMRTESPSVVIGGEYYECDSIRPPIPSVKIDPKSSQLERPLELEEPAADRFERYVGDMYSRIGEMLEQARKEETRAR